MPYCENCGSEVNANAKFCGNCGAARNPVVPAKEKAETKPLETKRKRLNYYSPPTIVPPSAPRPILGPQPVSPQTYQPQPKLQQAAPMQPQPAYQPQPMYQTQPTGETTIGVLPFRRMKSLGRYDTFVGVVTNQRMIIAQITGEMVKASIQQARDKAKAEGKGFFGQWADQLKGSFGYTDRYLTLPHQTILNETPGNFALYNNTITEIKIRLKGDDERAQQEFEAEIKSTSGTYKFHMNENSQLTDLLKRVYGERVKMPFGYFSKSVNIKL